MTEDKFWQECFDVIEVSMVGRCRECPYEDKCHKEPSIEDGGDDCATFLMNRFKDFVGR